MFQSVKVVDYQLVTFCERHTDRYKSLIVKNIEFFRREAINLFQKVFVQKIWKIGNECVSLSEL